MPHLPFNSSVSDTSRRTRPECVSLCLLISQFVHLILPVCLKQTESLNISHYDSNHYCHRILSAFESSLPFSSRPYDSSQSPSSKHTLRLCQVFFDKFCEDLERIILSAPAVSMLSIVRTNAKHFFLLSNELIYNVKLSETLNAFISVAINPKVTSG